MNLLDDASRIEIDYWKESYENSTEKTYSFFQENDQIFRQTDENPSKKSSQKKFDQVISELRDMIGSREDDFDETWEHYVKHKEHLSLEECFCSLGYDKNEKIITINLKEAPYEYGWTINNDKYKWTSVNLYVYPKAKSVERWLSVLKEHGCPDFLQCVRTDPDVTLRFDPIGKSKDDFDAMIHFLSKTTFFMDVDVKREDFFEVFPDEDWRPPMRWPGKNPEKEDVISKVFQYDRYQEREEVERES